METLRFFGWDPSMAVVELVSGRGALYVVRVPAPVGTGRLIVAKVSSPEDTARLPRGGADLAISSGNVPGWESNFETLNHFKALHGALRTGGILGVVENRSAAGASFRQMMQAGAVSEEHVIAMAEVAGFRLISRSEMNAGGQTSRMTLKFLKP
jgi:predicted methyltransferase